MLVYPSVDTVVEVPEVMLAGIRPAARQCSYAVSVSSSTVRAAV